MPGLFTGIKDGHLKIVLERFADLLRRRDPIGQFQYVDVTFTGGGADTDIPHTLAPLDPESVRWAVVKTSAGVTVYQDQSATRKKWQPTYIWLRATGAATTRILLFLENTQSA